jgi:hypothetical protein
MPPPDARRHTSEPLDALASATRSTALYRRTIMRV